MGTSSTSFQKIRPRLEEATILVRLEVGEMTLEASKFDFSSFRDLSLRATRTIRIRLAKLRKVSPRVVCAFRATATSSWTDLVFQIFSYSKYGPGEAR